jgi:hypothetical protein
VNKNFRLLSLIVIVLILVTVLLTGCGEKYTVEDGVISEVTMAAAVDSEGRPLQPTDVFPVDTLSFYCSVKLSHFPPGTQIKAEWIIMAGQAMIGVSDNTVLQMSRGIVEGDGYTAVELTRPDYEGVKWPLGDYVVIFYVEDVEKARTSFRVE